MTLTTRVETTATPLYPGSFFPEPGRPVTVPNAEPETVLATVTDDVGWFALEVRTVKQTLWTDGAGGEKWLPGGKATTYRIYVGEILTEAHVEALPGDHHILLSNMRGNGWERVVRTRAGNFQPIEPGDVVLTPAEAAK